jgi:hypothetical protein
MFEGSNLRTLSQTFRFPNASMDDLARVLADAPLTGGRSIFGNRKTRSTSSEGEVRRMFGFEPAPLPLLRFDVEMRQNRTEAGVEVLIEFMQPNIQRPYLTGQFVWLLSDSDAEGAVLQEEINTPAALSRVERPLSGGGLSFRRFLFFAGGHKRLMKEVAANLRDLLK